MASRHRHCSDELRRPDTRVHSRIRAVAGHARLATRRHRRSVPDSLGSIAVDLGRHRYCRRGPAWRAVRLVRGLQRTRHRGGSLRARQLSRIHRLSARLLATPRRRAIRDRRADRHAAATDLDDRLHVLRRSGAGAAEPPSQRGCFGGSTRRSARSRLPRRSWRHPGTRSIDVGGHRSSQSG